MMQELEWLEDMTDFDDDELMNSLHKLDHTLDVLEKCMDELEEELVHKNK